MNELIEMSTAIHIILVFVVLFVVFLGYKNTSDTHKSFANKADFAKHLRPQYNVVLSALFFTGIILWTVKNFTFSIEIIIMIGAWLFMIVSDIKRGKLLKKTNFKDENSQEIYLKNALKKHYQDFAILIGVGIVSYYLF